MSRVGNALINLPDKVEVTVSDKNEVTVKGPKGTISRKFNKDMIVENKDGVLTVKRPTDQKRHRELHGLSRALLNNMVVGVSEGFKKEMDVIGVGYRASVQGNLLELVVGYSHPIVFLLPQEVSATAETAKGSPPRVTITGIDKELVGQVAAKIRSVRKPEVYKGKGIRYVDEYVRRKQRKSVGK